MVVLSVGIVSSSKTLVARQFVEMTRLRVEGLLSAFSKLVDSGRDHTFIETETVRYVYQPMESLYLLLVTNKMSNILEDLETLRLLAKVVQDCCQTQVNEELVLQHAFDIVFAFDEVISFGHRESVTLSQIKTYTDMDSHEEKLHQMLEQSKINEAREMGKQKQMELAKQRANQPKDSSSATGFGNSMSTSSGTSMPGIGNTSKPMSFQDTMSDSMGDSGASVPPWSSTMNEDAGPTIKASGAPKKGMLLGKKKPVDLFAGLGGQDPSPSQEAAAEKQAEAAPAPVNPLLDPVKVQLEEKITAKMQVEGGLDGDVDCTGSFQVTVLDAAKADLVSFKLAAQSQAYKYKTHPNMNKASFANNILEVVNKSKAFKAGTPAPLVKWNMRTSDDAFLPVALSCWPTATSEGTQVVVEIEMTDSNVTLEDVHIRFPAKSSSRPAIASAEPGEANFNAGNEEVHWYIPVLDSSGGNMEFSAATDISALLPFTFQGIQRGETKCPMNIEKCYHMERQDDIAFMLEKSSTYVLTVGS